MQFIAAGRDIPADIGSTIFRASDTADAGKIIDKK
jgi:hypothetical protein